MTWANNESIVRTRDNRDLDTTAAPHFPQPVGLPDVGAAGHLEGFNIKVHRLASFGMFRLTKIFFRKSMQTDATVCLRFDDGIEIDVFVSQNSRVKLIVFSKHQFIKVLSIKRYYLIGSLKKLDQCRSI